jgi:hypothetical protein
MERTNGTIFISYRREDARADAGRLYDRLNTRYPGRVFQDIGSIEPGAEWRKTIDNVLRATAACVVVIGPEWLTVADQTGRRRIDDPHDVLRAEVASALASSGCRVFPVLVGEANMPRRSSLPDDLKSLASRHAIELTDQDFDAGYNKLAKALDRIVEPPTWRTPRMQLRLVAAVAAVVALVALAVTYTITRDAPPDREEPVEPSEPSEPEQLAETSGVGRITFRWSGAEATSWQVVNDKDPKNPRYLSVAGGSSDTADVDVGRYRVVIPDKPEIAPIPVTVTAGKTTMIAPKIGQITMQWSGTASTSWQVLDEKTRATVRHLAVGGRGSETVDIATGRYVVTFGQPEIPAVAVTVTADKASVVAPQVGQLTLYWTGANYVTWQLMDEKNRNLRHNGTGPGGSETIDVGSGSYLVTLSQMPEIAPIPVSVTTGKMLTVAPPVGRVTVQWHGEKPASLQVIDAERKNALRSLYVSADKSQTIDMAPGRYLIVPQGVAGVKAVEITVVDGEEVRAEFQMRQ